MVTMVTSGLILVAALSSQSATGYVAVQHRSNHNGRRTILPPSLLQSTTATKSDKASLRGSSSTPSASSTWQDDADNFLNPATPPSKRQQLLSKLIQQNSNIRASVEQAFRNGTIDPILTPTGRRVQEGTRTVAQQLVRDILPSIFSWSPPKPEDVFNTNQRVFQSMTTQMQQTFESMASDLADPVSRIPARIRHQTTSVASTVLSDTPVDLTEPTYRVLARYNVGTTDEYEVRDYDEYDVASTTIEDNVVAIAYQRLSSYIGGANAEHRVVSDVPVSMRTGNVLRFYVPGRWPIPLSDDVGVHRFVDGAHKIRIETIPAATLAVRRFTGFCTEGEIQRQKEMLLNIILTKNIKNHNDDDDEDEDDSDVVELDVDHGQPVGHLVFEYNPPVAVPIVRRNEIAIPVFINK